MLEHMLDHVEGYFVGPVWGACYRTEEGEAYELAGWLPLPKLKEV